MESRGYVIRKALALGALVALVGASLYWLGGRIWEAAMVACCPGWSLFAWGEVAFFGLLSAGVCAAAVGVARGSVWGRLAGLAVGLGAIWASGCELVYPMGRAWLWVLLGAGGLLLLGSLMGRTMYRTFDGRGAPEPATRLDRVRLAAVRWGAVVGLALLPFVASSLIHGHGSLAGGPLGWLQRPLMLAVGAGIVGGAVLVARQRTAGFLVVALSGTAAAWLFAPVVSCIGVRWFEVFCRAGHTALYILPVALFLAPIARKLRAR